MELDHEFTVPVPVDRAWPVLLDVERIAPCMPGATLDSIDGDEFTGRLKVRLGAMTVTYRGSARIAARDEATRTVTIEGSGKEARGSGTASATVQARLHDEGEHTRVIVHTKLNVTGRPAQFGRGILSEVGGKLIQRFADGLAEELARDETAGAVASATAATGTPAETGTDTGTPTESGTGDAATTAGSNGAAAGATATAGASVSGTEPAGDTGTPTATGTGNGTPTAPTPDAASSRTAPPADAGIPTESGGGTGAPAESTATATAQAASGSAVARPDGERRTRPGAEPIDLLEVAGPSIAKRAVPVLTAFALLWALWRVFRRRGR